MADLRILIVGASIAGPMTAYWLAKAGADVTVIERYPSLRKGGQAVDVRHSGVTIVRKVPKLEAALLKNAAPVQGTENPMVSVDNHYSSLIHIVRLGDGGQVRSATC